MTLPLSYSRLRSLTSLRTSAREARLRSSRSLVFYLPLCDGGYVSHQPAQRVARLVALIPSATPARQRLVAREGLEPSKPLGRQIYSLLRLTASLPRQESVFWNPCVRRVLCCLLLSAFLAYRFEFDRSSRLRSGAGEGIRTPDLLITNQLLYRPELRQPKQKWNYSTSCATVAIPAVSTIGGTQARLCPR